MNKISQYFSKKEKNTDLVVENSVLKMLLKENQLSEMPDFGEAKNFRFTMATDYIDSYANS